MAKSTTGRADDVVAGVDGFGRVTGGLLAAGGVVWTGCGETVTVLITGTTAEAVAGVAEGLEVDGVALVAVGTAPDD